VNKLKRLYDELIAEGCNRDGFYIAGISKTLPDDVFCIEEDHGRWEIYYSERGHKREVLLSTPDLDEAIGRYRTCIHNIEHWHLIAFTRSKKIFNDYKKILKENGLSVIRNDIPSYSAKNDRVFRLFVKNTDIFRARELFDELPYYDEDLKKK
jgi:hypothetical protein